MTTFIYAFRQLSLCTIVLQIYLIFHNFLKYFTGIVYQTYYLKKGTCFTSYSVSRHDLPQETLVVHWVHLLYHNMSE